LRIECDHAIHDSDAIGSFWGQKGGLAREQLEEEEEEEEDDVLGREVATRRQKSMKRKETKSFERWGLTCENFFWAFEVSI
jgi:hypothetical protein